MARIHVLTLQADRSGGAGVYALESTRRLAARGHVIDLIAYAADPELDAVCTVHRLTDPDWSRVPGAWRAAHWLRRVAAGRQLARLPLVEPDVVVSHSPMLAAAYRRQFPRVPLVYVPHGSVSPVEVAAHAWRSTIQRRLAVGAFHRWERDALRRAARTVRFTRSACRVMSDYYPGVDARFEVIAPGIDLPTTPASPRPARPPRLLSVGRLVESKHLSLALRALAPLRHLPWHSDIVGDGPELPRLRAEAATLGLADRVTFHGRRDEVSDFYRRADLFLFPSRLESFGLVLIEAMAHGVPALAVRADGATFRNVSHEIITPGRDGFLADGEAGFVACLAALLAEPGRLTAAGAEAARIARERYDWNRHIERFEAVLREVIAPGGLLRPSLTSSAAGRASRAGASS